MRIATDEEIQNYLLTERPVCDFSREREIWGRRQRITQIPVEGFKTLSLKRVASSTTLQKDFGSGREQLIGWDDANRFLSTSIERGVKFSPGYVRELNRLIVGGEGKFRRAHVYSADMRYLAPSYLNQMFETLESLLEGQENPFLKAFLSYMWVVTLHPFENGNGRTARSGADWILLENNLVPLCFSSSVDSHVAVTVGGEMRSIQESYRRFLQGIENSLAILESATSQT